MEDNNYDEEYEARQFSSILNQMNRFESKHYSIDKLKAKTEKKMNRYKLLMYNKLLNILFGTISQHIRNLFQLFKQKTISVYYRAPPPEYVRAMVKMKERIERRKKIQEKSQLKVKKQKIKEQSKKNKTKDELEYERYQEQRRLEKIKTAKREKERQQEIEKEKYAEKIYTIMKKRNFLVSLKFNVELNKVANSFLSNIHNKIILFSVIKKIKLAAQNKRVSEIKKEKIKEKIALNKYHKTLKRNFLSYFKLIEEYYHNKYSIIQNELKNYKRKRIVSKLREKIKREKQEDNEKIKLLKERKRNRYKKNCFYILLSNKKAKREQEAKENLIKHLKIQAKKVLGNYN